MRKTNSHKIVSQGRETKKVSKVGKEAQGRNKEKASLGKVRSGSNKRRTTVKREKVRQEKETRKWGLRGSGKR